MPTLIDTSTVPQSFTRFPVKIHDEAHRISALSSAAAEETFQRFTKTSAPHSKGLYGDVCAMCYPDGDVERVRICAEIIEILWIYDGESTVIEALPRDVASREHDIVTHLLENGTKVSSPDEYTISNILRDVAARVSALDPVHAPYVSNILKQTMREYDSCSLAFNTWEEGLHFGVLNVGFRMLDAFVQWTLDIYLTTKETEVSGAFYVSAGRTLGLTNDYFSWNMEKRSPTNRTYNTVPVVMKHYGMMSEKDALIFVKGLAVDAEETTMKLAKPLKEFSSNVKRYVEGVEYVLRPQGTPISSVMYSSMIRTQI
ncbi:isoprenoid synthase domain-containing protein [Mycena crocata]|nr:isoprenoid synthase domain-containing protein [Mycena crocata]